jgi:acyl-CoA reductase-like NAD-dependent aldehyde dehydrogenase
MKALPHYTRKKVLLEVATKIKERFQDFTRAIVVEVGKPLRDAEGEVNRAIDGFTCAAEEAVRINGDYLNLDITDKCQGFQGIVKRFPVGPISMISPFNFPLNLVVSRPSLNSCHY